MSDGLCECGCGQRTSLAPQSSTKNGYVKGEPVRFIRGHANARTPVAAVEFIETPDTNCWVWQRNRSPDGYGLLRIVGRQGGRAHRHYYEELIGPIPDGLTLDHLCRNRACVNPGHIEPATNRENVLRGIGASAENARKTHCVHGHPFDEGNTYVWHGKRFCRVCKIERQRQMRRAA